MRRRYIWYKNCQLGYYFEFFTLGNQLFVVNSTAGLLWQQILASPACSSNSQLVMHKIWSHFATGLVCASREAVLKLTAWNLPCCDKCNLESRWKNNRSYHWVQCSCTSSQYQLALQFATTMMKKKEIRPNLQRAG